MKEYRVTAVCRVEVVTLVYANSEEEAINEAIDRDVSICVHGSECADGCANDMEFVLVDGCSNGLNNYEVEQND